MLRIKKLLLLIWIIGAVVIYVFISEYTAKEGRKSVQNKAKAPQSHFKKFSISEIVEIQMINVVSVVCGARLRETLVMIKSAVIFRHNASLVFIILADYDLQRELNERLSEWKSIIGDTFDYELRNLSFPEGRREEWRKLFQPCASQRLFLPVVLSKYEKIIYVDTDTIFLTPLIDIWNHFSAMNSSQIAALAPEHEDPNTGWYNRFARHPYYGKLGVNSGVMLMDLKKMREFKWVDYLQPIYQEYKLKLTWGDQDIINIIFSYHPDKLYVYSCRYNYRPDHCMYMSVCKEAERDGVAVLHGSRGAFRTDKHAVFKAIYKVFDEYALGSDISANLLTPAISKLNILGRTRCGEIRRIFIKNMAEYLERN